MVRVTLLVLASILVTQLYGQEQPRKRGGRAYEGVREKVLNSGVQVGQEVPQVKLHTTDGKDTTLASAWKQKPALIVTASITCPIAKQHCPSVVLAEQKFGDKVNAVILYTIEAHPRDGRSPYDPFKGQRSRFPYDQPDKLEDRLKLAREFSQTVPQVTMLVDNMKDEGWSKLGGGPNMAVLVNTDGKVLAKQGWFDAELMQKEIEKLPAGKKAPPPAG